MTKQGEVLLCPAAELSAIVEAARISDELALQRLDVVLPSYAHDARLHFLRGSLLASRRSYAEAREAMGTAVALAPEYGVARFQLGLLRLTSGDADGARAALLPLTTPGEGYLRRFASALILLIEDRLPESVSMLDAGVEENLTLLPMNADMRLLRDEIARHLREAASEAPPPSSSTELLLKYLTKRGALH